MKKKYSIAAIILIGILLLTNISFAAISATASFTPNKTTAKKGEYVTCTFSVSTQDNFNGFEGVLTYDKDFFSDVTAESNYVINLGRGIGESGLIGIESTENIQAGTLFTVKLKVNENTTKESGKIAFSTSSDLMVFDANDTCNLTVSPITITLDTSEDNTPAVPAGNTEDNSNEENTNQRTDAGTEQGSKQEKKPDTSTNPIPNTGKEVMFIAIAIVTVAIIGTVAIIKFKNVIK